MPSLFTCICLYYTVLLTVITFISNANSAFVWNIVVCSSPTNRSIFVWLFWTLSWAKWGKKMLASLNIKKNFPVLFFHVPTFELPREQTPFFPTAAINVVCNANTRSPLAYIWGNWMLWRARWGRIFIWNAGHKLLDCNYQHVSFSARENRGPSLDCSVFCRDSFAAKLRD